MDSNFSIVADTLIEVAKQGNVNVQLMLAQHYLEGNGVPKDIEEAMKWFKMAADQGAASAQYNLGQYYMKKNDMSEAVKWYRKAAEQGFSKAQYALALRYEK